MLGKHTVSFGASYTYTQLNTIDKRTGTGTVATDDFSQMLQGFVTPGSSATGFYVTSFLQGNASRYYRANQLGTYVQDKCQITPTLSLTAGVRYDWDGGLTEKYGRIFNFDPSLYSYNVGSDTITNPGLIIAGNNANGTKGVSNTTLTGRQWGIGPRVGAAWQPEMFHSKVVVRTGGGMYYDRGELFSYFSPGYAIGTVTGGPFGVNQQLPFVNAQTCPTRAVSLRVLHPHLRRHGGMTAIPSAPRPSPRRLQPAILKIPTRTSRAPHRPTPRPPTSATTCPTPASIDERRPAHLAGRLRPRQQAALHHQLHPRYSVAAAQRPGHRTRLRGQHRPPPGHSGAVQPARHRLARRNPSPAAPTSRITATATTSRGADARPTARRYLANYEGGNVDLRVPYIGYAAESIDYRAAGVDAYNALQAHVEKRMSHGIQVGASYTWSHALDEQSGLGLFYNGNNPLNLRSGYGSSDFDRTHVINFNYVFQLPDFVHEHRLAGKFTDGWSLIGAHRAAERPALQRHRLLRRRRQHLLLDLRRHHQPHRSAGPGCTPKNAMTGASGAFGPGDGSPRSMPPASPFRCFRPAASAAPFPPPIPIETDFTTGQRNIFRQAFQKRADASLVKMTKLTERYTLKYTFDVYNLTNTTSFDIPGNEVSQNQNYNGFPAAGTPVLPTSCDASNAGFYNCPSGLGVVTTPSAARARSRCRFVCCFRIRLQPETVAPIDAGPIQGWRLLALQLRATDASDALRKTSSSP